MYNKVEHAIAAIEIAQTASWETVGSKASDKMTKGRKSDHAGSQSSALDSILLQGAGGSEGISCDGRLLLVTSAISRTAAADVNASKKDDRRNMRLAKEGVILRGSPEAAGLSAADLDRREASWNEKKKKLQNPNFFVSNTRVSVRNLAKEVDGKVLKDFFLQACDSQGAGGTKGKGKGKPKVLKAKLVTELNSKGEAVSKGFGFVEFDDEDAALRAIRAIVNPSSPMLLCGRRPMVEFSVENIQVVRLKKIRSDRLKARQVTEKESRAPAAAEPPAKKRFLTPKERRLELSQKQSSAGAAPQPSKRSAAAAAHSPPARRQRR
jgi:nucleolar protein 4